MDVRIQVHLKELMNLREFELFLSSCVYLDFADDGIQAFGIASGLCRETGACGQILEKLQSSFGWSILQSETWNHRNLRVKSCYEIDQLDGSRRNGWKSTGLLEEWRLHKVWLDLDDSPTAVLLVLSRLIFDVVLVHFRRNLSSNAAKRHHLSSPLNNQ